MTLAIATSFRHSTMTAHLMLFVVLLVSLPHARWGGSAILCDHCAKHLLDADGGVAYCQRPQRKIGSASRRSRGLEVIGLPQGTPR